MQRPYEISGWLAYPLIEVGGKLLATAFEPYMKIEAESFAPARNSGLHDSFHMRPTPGQVYGPELMIQCSKTLTTKYPVGTRYRMRVKLTDREDGGQFLYSYHGWRVEILGKPDEA